mmetsp:Transcript_126156/g.353258  ORF Transcript_126156/g.353258 Transcript_126156/m.353258 type:complete len:297 (+) Transcript_126156:178-1068(+)
MSCRAARTASSTARSKRPFATVSFHKRREALLLPHGVQSGLRDARTNFSKISSATGASPHNNSVRNVSAAAARTSSASSSSRSATASMTPPRCVAALGVQGLPSSLGRLILASASMPKQAASRTSGRASSTASAKSEEARNAARASAALTRTAFQPPYSITGMEPSVALRKVLAMLPRVALVPCLRSTWPLVRKACPHADTSEARSSAAAASTAASVGCIREGLCGGNVGCATRAASESSAAMTPAMSRSSAASCSGMLSGRETTSTSPAREAHEARSSSPAAASSDATQLGRQHT